MTTQQDCSIGISAAEATYGTYSAPTRHFEFDTETFNYKPTYLQGTGLRVAAPLARQARRATGMLDATGSLELEAYTRGLGVLFQAALGNSVSTALADTPVYQQLHTPTTTDYLNSYTIQQGVPPLGGGATLPVTYPGCVCDTLEITVAKGGLVMLKTDWLGRQTTTAQGYVAPVYPSAGELYTFIHGSIVLGGTIVLPTTTALASGGTAVGDITDWSLKYENKLDSGGWTFGNAGLRGRKPAVGLRNVTGQFTAEFDSSTLRDAYLNQTPLAMVMTFQTATTIGTTSKPTLQIVAPLIMLEGDTPNANKGGLITQTIPYTVLDNGVAASGLYIVNRTLDTAI